MTFSSRIPSAALAPFVHRLWYHEAPECQQPRERLLPMPTLQLLVNLDRDALQWWDGPALSTAHQVGGAAVSGIYGRPIAIAARDQRRVVGAVLRPAAAAVLLGVPADALASTHTDLAALWGPAARQLREQLLEAATPCAVLALLERTLVARITQRADLDPALGHACQLLEGGAAVARVAEQLGLGPKRFRSQFAAAAGIAPKAYARITRLQRLLRLANTHGNRRWAELAADCGYYDQAHLILEFRELTGLTPSAYRPRTHEAHNHVVL